MRKATASKKRGIRWNFTTVLEDWNVGGGSSQSRNKKRNARKCKTLRTECASNREKIVVDDEEVDDVEEFTFLRAILDKEGGGHYPPSAESTWRIPETTEDLGS